MQKRDIPQSDGNGFKTTVLKNRRNSNTGRPQETWIALDVSNNNNFTGESSHFSISAEEACRQEM